MDYRRTHGEAPCIHSTGAGPAQALGVWYSVCFSEATGDVVLWQDACTSTQGRREAMPEQPDAETGPCPLEALPLHDIYIALGTQPQGLMHAEAAARLQRYGRNTIRPVAATPLVRKFLANFTHLMALLLWVGGLLGFLAQMPQLGVAIWLVNLINGAFSFWQEYQAEQATAALQRLLPTYARVVREGQEQQLLAEDLVPGDVMLLAEGEHISADGRLVQAADLRVDQSTLTGEAHPVRKTAEAVLRGGLTHVELPNLVFAGTSVAAGTGTAVVVCHGNGQ